MAAVKPVVECLNYNGSDSDECKQHIQKAFTDCAASKEGISARAMRDRLTKQYKYACLIIKNIQNASDTSIGEVKFVYSLWKYGDDQYGVYIITGVKGDMQTEIK